MSTTMLEIQMLGDAIKKLTNITSENNLFHLPNANSITTYT